MPLGILDGIVDWLATQVMNLLDLASTSVLGALGCNMDTFKRYFPAASAMYEIFIWTAIGLFGRPDILLFDLFYMAGVPLESQRVASPFISQAISSLHLYKAIDPDTWGRMIGRVNGANFAALYGRTAATGWQSVKLPKGMTWEGYMHFLLSTLPERTRNNYLEKLSVSIRFWREKGGCLPDETIAKLQKAGIRIEIGGKSAYRTDKRPVRMEYLDDIDLPEFSRLPTFKRICICILKNDHACKYMGFSPNKSETQRRNKIMEKYESLLQHSDKSTVPEPCL